MVRVGVIGAGPSGLSALCAFKAEAAKGGAIPEVVCFERQSDWGGLWNSTWRTGHDEHGEPVHSGMYRDLWSNGPKECLELADFTFDAHFGRPVPSYPPRAALADYVTARARKAGAREWIRFRTAVRSVVWDAATSQFDVTVHDLLRDRVYTERLDWLIVASGHFSVPHLPDVDGLARFAGGRVLHAHEFRDAREFAGRRVLLVGASYSAEDIGSQLTKFGAASVTISYRSTPMVGALPANWTQRPLLVRVDGSACHFCDGSSAVVDAIIFCTGYKHSFPFLPDELRLRTHTCLYPPGLYRGVVWTGEAPQPHRLLYIGMQDQWWTFSFFDLMAYYARDLILGRIALPPRAEMLADNDAWALREASLVGDEQMVRFQGEHVRVLQAATDYPPFDSRAVDALFLEFEHAKRNNFLGYRDLAHRSIITGTMAPFPRVAWTDNMDDSLEAFLGQLPPRPGDAAAASEPLPPEIKCPAECAPLVCAELQNIGPNQLLQHAAA